MDLLTWSYNIGLWAVWSKFTLWQQTPDQHRCDIWLEGRPLVVHAGLTHLLFSYSVKMWAVKHVYSTATAWKRLFLDLTQQCPCSQSRARSVKDHPAQSHDLSPIQHLQDDLEHWLRARPYQKPSVPDLTNALVAEWEKIPTARFQSLVQSHPRRAKPVTAAGWFPSFKNFNFKICCITSHYMIKLFLLSKYSATDRVCQYPHGPAGAGLLKGTACASESMLKASLCRVTTMPTIWDWRSTRRLKRRQLKHKEACC